MKLSHTTSSTEDCQWFHREQKDPNYLCSPFGSPASPKGLSSYNCFLQKWGNNMTEWNTQYSKKESAALLAASGESHPYSNIFHIAM